MSVCYQATFDKFGYWPGPGHYGKLLIVRCEKCKKTRTIKSRGLKEARQLCKKCSNEKNSVRGVRRMQEIYRERLERGIQNTKISVSPLEWIKYYTGHNVRFTLRSDGKPCGRPFLQCPALSRRVPVHKSYALFYHLAGNETVPKDTSQWKDLLVLFLSRQSESYKFAVMNALYNPRPATPSLIHLKWDRWSPVFKVLPCRVVPCVNGKYMKILQGSFYKDGRWIHIG